MSLPAPYTTFNVVAPKWVAHSPNHLGYWHDLSEHLCSVRDLAHDKAQLFGLGALAGASGFLHDLGKFKDEFQAYIRESHRCQMAAEPQPRFAVSHALTGAVYLTNMLGSWDPLALFLGQAIACHHTGLRNLSASNSLGGQNSYMAMRERAMSQGEYLENERAIANAETEFPLSQSINQEVRDEFSRVSAPGPLSEELALRFTFASLCWADRWDTRRHGNPAQIAARERCRLADVPSLLSMWQENLLSHRAGLQTTATPQVARLRDHVFQKGVEVVEGAGDADKFFAMPAPVGSGKTYCCFNMALALALKFGHERILFLTPQKLITGQVFAEAVRAMGAGSSEHMLEHHSSSPMQSREATWDMEDYEGSVFVSGTHVQFFESLHSASPNRLKKLVNFPNSVVVIDECHALPLDKFSPHVALMRELAQNYNIRFIFSSGTMPDWAVRVRGYEGLAGIVLVLGDQEEVDRLHRSAARMTFRFDPQPCPWERLAPRVVSTGKSSFAIVNTRADALAIHSEVLGVAGGADVLYLTSALCVQHRRNLIAQVKQRLVGQQLQREQGIDPVPFFLIATSLLESGIDLDFPHGFRALAPMESLIQASGRTNRNGRLPYDECFMDIFVASETTMRGRDEFSERTMLTLRQLERSGAECLHTPSVYRDYYSYLVRNKPSRLDTHGILAMRRSKSYESVELASAFIEGNTVSILVDYDQGLYDSLKPQLVQALGTGDRGAILQLSRQIQPYIVELPLKKLEILSGLEELVEGSLYACEGSYDDELGLGYLWA